MCNACVLHIPIHMCMYTHTHTRRSLFWIDTGDVEHPNQSMHPKIYTLALDGSRTNAIITANLGRPLYVTVDNPGANGRIYWTDSYYDRIESATLNGGDRRVVLGERERERERERVCVYVLYSTVHANVRPHSLHVQPY